MAMDTMRFEKMGMFDSIFLKMKCPYCGETHLMEFQTKDLSNSLSVFKKGGFVGKKFTFLEVTGDCHSNHCQDVADKRDMIRQGTPSGFGALFEAKVEVKDGVITGKIYDLVLEEESTEKFVNKHKIKWKDTYKGRKNGKAIVFPRDGKNGRMF